MFVDLEKSLLDALHGAIPTAQMYGTFDFVDMASEDAPPVAVRVAWRGFPVRQQKHDAISGSHQFSVDVMVSGLRIKPADQQRISNGIATIYRRLVAWRPRPEVQDVFAEIESAGVAESGAVFQYQINLTVPGYVIRQSQ